MIGWKGDAGIPTGCERQLLELFKAAQVAVSAQDLDAILDKLLRVGMEGLAMPAGSVAIYNPETRQLVLRAHRGLSAGFVARDKWEVEEAGVTQRILQRGEPFIIEDTQKTFAITPWPLEKEGIRSLLATPLKCHNKVVGIFYLDDFVPRRFQESQIQLLSVLGAFASLCIENAKVREEVDFFTRTDHLTRLYNQNHFKMTFQQELARSNFYRFPLSLVLFDIDDLRRFNDTFGHSNGDQVLVTVAHLLRDSFREFDSLFRYGGEEFMALLPETNLEQAVKIAESARNAISRKSHRDLPITGAEPVTVSAAAVSCPRDGKDLDSLLKQLDTLLFQGKGNGNRVYWQPD